MTSLTNHVWDLIVKEYETNYRDDLRFELDYSKRDKFTARAKEIYDDIKTKHMHPNVKYLDRHKVTASLIISLLEIDAITYKDLEGKYIFIGSQLIALKVGLAYMLEKLNEKIDERGVEKRITDFTLPDAQSCETPYLEIMCRNLFLAQRDYKFNPLDLADRLFLVEYILLMKNGIDPDVLKDY